MVTFLILLAIPVIIGIAIYFWQKPSVANPEFILPPPPPDARGLFGDVQPLVNPGEIGDTAEELILAAQRGEKSTLAAARATDDRNLYDRVLRELVRQADSDTKLLALMSYVSQHQLPVKDALARAVMNSWLKSPNRNTTSKALHFAALSDNAGIYREAVEEALRLWRAGRVPDVSPTELTALFDGEFWILSSLSRSSGAGFVLKQTLADARRELEAAASANP